MKESAIRIYVDADAFPNPLKEILYRAVTRTATPLVLIACQYVRVPESPLIESLAIEAGPDAADDWIAARVEPGDLVVTADIPLADRVVTRGASALDPRGTLYDAANVKERLAVRDLLDTLRGGGMITGGPKPFGPRDREAFANSLNAFLQARSGKKPSGGP